MFKTFFDDLTYLPRKKFSAKYIMPALIFLLSCVVVGQLITIFIPLNQLNKTSRTIISKQTEIISRSHARFSQQGTPNYALVITLSDMSSYNVQEKNGRAELGATLKNGDYVTIYYPTSTVKILSFGLVQDVSQVERGGQVLYSWKQQQNETWFLVVVFLVLIAFFYWTMGYMRDYVDSSMLK
ncbi:MAG TPA: hypothetical protein VGN20_04790 [Mucilaginibacter sp.]|jgi:uncharacterized integral membrane protein